MLFLGPAVVTAVVLLFFSDRFRDKFLRFTCWKAVLVALWWFIPRDTHVDHVYMSPFMGVVYLIRDLFCLTLSATSGAAASGPIDARSRGEAQCASPRDRAKSLYYVA